MPDCRIKLRQSPLRPEAACPRAADERAERPQQPNESYRYTTNLRTYPIAVIETIGIPDSKLCKEITELVRDTESELLFNHSSRVYYFGALTGLRRGLRFDRELLYAGAMFHDIGLMPQHSSRSERFEVDGAHAARDFLIFTRGTRISAGPSSLHNGHPPDGLPSGGSRRDCSRRS
jgi:HD domain